MTTPQEADNGEHNYRPEAQTYPQPATTAGADQMGQQLPSSGHQGPPPGAYQGPPSGAYQGLPSGEYQTPPPSRSVRTPRRSFGTQAGELARHLRTPETKEFFKTSEFALTILGVLILMLAAAAQANFDAPQMWRLVTAILVAYIISRGIAKAGTGRGGSDVR